MTENPYTKFIDQCGDLLNKGDIPRAKSMLDAYLAMNPDDPVALYLMGSAYLDGDHIGRAMCFLQKSVALEPTLDFAWHNFGVALRRAERYEEAIAAYEKALSLEPERPDTMAMLAGSHVNNGNPNPAIFWAKECLKREPDNCHAWNHLALGCLEAGRWKEGWAAYERRWDVPDRLPFKRDYGAIPKWTGEKVGTLVLHGEQGVGDEILFMSLFHEIRNADRIVIECTRKLKRLFERSFGCPVYTNHDDLMAAEKPDAWLPMGDLPRLYRNTQESFDNQLPSYLTPDPEKVKSYRAILESMGPGPYVGIAWLGGTGKTNILARCIDLPVLQPILDSATCVSVQYETFATKSQAQRVGLAHWENANADIDEQAALISACDLVVTICQTAVHLAGALGKTCWVMVPSRPAWRYGLTSKRMVWYPSVTLYRQGKDWPEVVERVNADLRKIPGVKQNAA